MDPRIEQYGEDLKKDVKEAKHLSPEHKELLVNHITDALACTNGNPDKLPLIARVVAMSELRRIRGEMRVSDEIEKAMAGMEERFTKSVTDLFQKHTLSCPAAEIDFAKFATKAEVSARDGKAKADTSRFSFGKLTLTGTPAKMAVVALTVLVAIYLIMARQEASLKEELNKTLPKLVLQSIKAQATGAKATVEKEDEHEEIR